MTAAPVPDPSDSNWMATLDWARAQDRADPLAPFRARFVQPGSLPQAGDAVGTGTPLIYLCGHSLGLAPRAARAAIMQEVSDWEQLGVAGHHAAHVPWIEYAERLQQPLAQLVGAEAHEVVAMNSLSVNLHLLLAAFYRPRGPRRAILIEAGAFSSDRHAVAAQLAWHGLDPQQELIEVAPAPGADLLRIEDIESCIAATGERLALVLWPGVQYRTGQNFDLGRVARAAHAVGALCGFDLAHSIGNVPLQLHTDAADFAVWCSYKYLNAGPGALGGAFIHEQHHQHLPRLAGWWGHEPQTRFQMQALFQPARGAAGFAVSNPPVFSAAALRASLPLFIEAGMPALRRKSIALTACFERLVLERAGAQLQRVTPADPEQRGCQLSWRVRAGAEHGRAVFAALSAAGVVADWREPDLIRLTPVPLYNSFEQVARAAWLLSQLVRARSG